MIVLGLTIYILQAGCINKVRESLIDKVELNVFYLYKSLKRKVVNFLLTGLLLEKVAQFLL